MKESMFCFQCQETAKGTGCTVRGVCGKNSTTSARMDLLLFVIRGISIAAHTLRTHRILPDPQVNAFVIDALFSTITNANFDEKSITERINRGFNLRNRLVAQASSAGITFPSADELTWNGAPEAYDDKAAEVGVLREPNEDLRSLKELIVYGLKGMAAYTGHAMRLGYDNPALHEFIQRTLSDIAIGNLSVGELTARVLQTGTFGVQAMALLDQANTGYLREPGNHRKSTSGRPFKSRNPDQRTRLARPGRACYGTDRRYGSRRVYPQRNAYLHTTIRHSKNTNTSPETTVTAWWRQRV